MSSSPRRGASCRTSQPPLPVITCVLATDSHSEDADAHSWTTDSPPRNNQNHYQRSSGDTVATSSCHGSFHGSWSSLPPPSNHSTSSSSNPNQTRNPHATVHVHVGGTSYSISQRAWEDHLCQLPWHRQHAVDDNGGSYSMDALSTRVWELLLDHALFDTLPTSPLDLNTSEWNDLETLALSLGFHRLVLHLVQHHGYATHILSVKELQRAVVRHTTTDGKWWTTAWRKTPPPEPSWAHGPTRVVI